MNVCSRILLSCLTVLATSPLIAQRRPDQVPTITVMTFQSMEYELGAKAADQLRDRFSRERQLTMIPSQRVVDILEQSGFDPLEPLPKNDEIQLANLLRANEYVTGSIDREGDKEPYRIKAYLMLLRGKEAIPQPLPIVEERRLGRAIDRLRDEIRDARKQLEGERECTGRALSARATGDDPAKRLQFYQEAIAAGREGVKEYPQGTLARLCVANVQYSLVGHAENSADSAQWIDSTLATVREILEIDSTSIPALTIAADLYKVQGNTDEAQKALVALVKADPQNTRLVDQVINELAASGNSKAALPFVKDMLERSPGDPSVLRTAFLVYLDAEEYAEAAEIGPELIRADTSAADSLYYIRIAQAYLGLGQPEKAAQAYAEGSGKFPQNTQLMLFHYAALEKAGKVDESIDILRRIVTLDRSQLQPNLLLANHYINNQQSDSAYVVLRNAEEAIKDSADRANLGQMALKEAQANLQKGQAEKDTSAVALARRFADLSYKLSPTGPAMYIAGNASLLAAQNYALAAEGPKSCSLAQSAKEALNAAEKSFADLADDVMFKAALEANKANVTQLKTAIDYQVETFCK